MDAALRDGIYCTGSAWDIPHFYPPSLRHDARGLLETSRQLAAGQRVYEQRVAMIASTFALLEEFIGMMEARTRVDFVSAQQHLDRLDAVAEKLMAYRPTPMLSAGRHSTYINYMRRYFRPATEGGYKHVTQGNRLVAAAGDEWSFRSIPRKSARPSVCGAATSPAAIGNA